MKPAARMVSIPSFNLHHHYGYHSPKRISILRTPTLSIPRLHHIHHTSIMIIQLILCNTTIPPSHNANFVFCSLILSFMS